MKSSVDGTGLQQSGQTHSLFSPAAWSIPREEHLHPPLQLNTEVGTSKVVFHISVCLTGPACCSSHLPALLEHIWSPTWSALLLPHCVMNCISIKHMHTTGEEVWSKQSSYLRCKTQLSKYLLGLKKGDFLLAANQNSARERRCAAVTFISLHRLSILPGLGGSMSCCSPPTALGRSFVFPRTAQEKSRSAVGSMLSTSLPQAINVNHFSIIMSRRK